MFHSLRHRIALSIVPISCVVWLSAQSAQSAPSAPSAQSEGVGVHERLDQSAWTSFTWHSVIANGRRLDRAALLVPATIAGLPGVHALQVDTGAHDNLLHGGAVADVDGAYAARLGQVASLSGHIAGAAVHDEPFGVIPGYRAIFTRGEPTPVIGTLGLRFFASRVLLIDFPRQRLAVLEPGASVPPQIERIAEFLPIELRDGKIHVPVTIDGATQTGYFFDTGASLFPLVTSRPTWERLTARTFGDPRNERLTVPTWADTWIELVGAPLRGRLAIGSARRDAPMIYFVNDPRLGFDRVPGPSGLVGNALFADAHLVIVDLPRRRIGLARSAELPLPSPPRAREPRVGQ